MMWDTRAMRRFISTVVLIALAIVIVMFAVANRATIAVSFDPFNSVQPALLVSLPMFVLIFILLAVGVFIGGVAAWLRQHRWRARARRAEAEARDLRARIDGERARRPLPRAVDSPPFAVPPAA